MTLCIKCKGTGNIFVSNAVSNAGGFVHPMTNLSGQKVLRLGEIWT